MLAVVFIRLLIGCRNIQSGNILNVNNDFYYECAFQWKGKEKELEERVLKLENDMRLAGAL
jgi:hypothetical protein